MNDLDKENKLDVSTYEHLLAAIPKEDRDSFDKPANILISLLTKDHSKINTNVQKKLFDSIDFNKLNEQTLENCKDSERIPAEYITQAALTLCAKLRKELDEANLKLKAFNIRTRPSRDSSYSSPIKNAYPTSKYTALRKSFLISASSKYS